MSTTHTTVTTAGQTHSSQNRHIKRLIEVYHSGSGTDRPTVPYDMFKLASIAYLKENNEVVGTLATNEEFRDELFNFIEDIYKSDQLKTLVKQYSTTTTQ